MTKNTSQTSFISLRGNNSAPGQREGLALNSASDSQAKKETNIFSSCSRDVHAYQLPRLCSPRVSHPPRQPDPPAARSPPRL